MVDQARLIRTLKQLIALDSQNPPGDERRVAGFVEPPEEGEYEFDLLDTILGELKGL